MIRRCDPQTPSLWLLRLALQPLKAPDALNPVGVHIPARDRNEARKLYYPPVQK
jgi:hypothetical protein